MGRDCKIGPRSLSTLMRASNWVRETANGALFTVAIRCPGMAKLKLSAVAMTTLAAQLICFSRSSSTSTQHFSVASRLARPPAASRISKLPQPISLATAQTASSSPTSPSSSSVTQMDSMPSDSSTRMSSSLITCPFASNFLPPGRKTVQQSTRPFDDFTSTVWARMFFLNYQNYRFVYPVKKYSTFGVEIQVGIAGKMADRPPAAAFESTARLEHPKQEGGPARNFRKGENSDNSSHSRAAGCAVPRSRRSTGTWNSEHSPSRP